MKFEKWYENETTKPLPPVAKTAEGVRDALFDEINLLRAGKVSTIHARSMANLVRQLIDAARLEFQHHTLKNGKRVLQLGS